MKLPELKERLKNKYTVRIIAGVLVIALAGTGFGITSIKADNNETTAVSESSDSDEDDTLDIDADEILDGISISDDDVDKEESVYLISDASGNVNQTIVVDHLTNLAKDSTLTDESNLSDIENVDGDQEFTQNGSTLTWQADGDEIYYRGTTTEEAPVTQKVTYYLDGEEISPEDLAGKSGKVTIHFDYTNNATYKETIDGEEYEVNVPFAAVTALSLGDNFTNVEVTNGKKEKSGDNTLVIGYALPGLKDSLNLTDEDTEDVTIPEDFEVTADVENFSLDMAMTYVTNAGSVIESDGTSSLDSIDDSMNELTDAMDQLMDGGDELEDGCAELADGVGTLKSKLETYLDGVKTVNKGMSTLKSGTTTLASGMNTLNSGASTLYDGTKTLASGIKTYTDGVASAKSGADTLNTGIASLTKGIKLLRSTVATNYATYKSAAEAISGTTLTTATDGSGADDQAVKAAVTQATTEYTTALVAYTAAADNAALKAVQNFEAYDTTNNSGAYASLYSSLEQLGSVAGGGVTLNTTTYTYEANATAMTAKLKAALTPTYGEAAASTVASSIASTLETYINTALSDATVKAYQANYVAKLQALSTASTSATTYASAKGAAVALGSVYSSTSAMDDTTMDTLATGMNTLATGLGTLTDSNDKLTSGANSLESGAKKISEGTQTIVDKIPSLTSGIKKLSAGTSKLAGNNDKIEEGLSDLADGADKLADGSTELSDGLVKFNEEGIEKLVNSYNGDIKPLANRLQAVIDAADSYTSFSGISDKETGSVKFIYKLDSIEADDAE